MDDSVKASLESIYDALSKRRAKAAYMYVHTDGDPDYECEWDECRKYMREVEANVAEEGYKFERVKNVVEGRIAYDICKLVPVEKVE